MAAIAENRKFDTKKNHLKSSPLKLTWPIGTRLWWNGNIKIQKVNSGRTDDGRPVVANAHLTLRVRRVKKILRK
jgi:hypothetical protein